MFWLGVVVGAVLASIPWWIKVRGLSGVKSDVKDAVDSARKVVD